MSNVAINTEFTLNFTGYYIDPKNLNKIIFKVSFKLKNGKLHVQWITDNYDYKFLDSHDFLNTGNEDVIEVAFYPVLSRDRSEYVMSLWRYNTITYRREMVSEQLLLYSESAYENPALLFGIRNQEKSFRKLLFSKSAIDKSFEDKVWTNKLGLNIVCHPDSYLLASKMSHQLPAQIQPVESEAHTTDTKQEDKWMCAICHYSKKGDKELVAAHDPEIVENQKKLLHVFHRECLECWASLNKKSPSCPTCRKKLKIQPISQWSIGDLVLKSSMGVNPFIRRTTDNPYICLI
jgi:hypothetical protein